MEPLEPENKTDPHAHSNPYGINLVLIDLKHPVSGRN